MEGWIRRWLGHGTSMDGWCTCLVSGRRRGRSNTPSSFRFLAMVAGIAALWRAAVDGTLAELVRAADRMRSTAAAPSTYPSIEMLREDRAQATVEAALLIPSFLLLLLLMLQPVCLFYTRAVMECAAAETARLMTTATWRRTTHIGRSRLRRFAAIPNLAIFHAGGADGLGNRVRARDGDRRAGARLDRRFGPAASHLGRVCPGDRERGNGYGDVLLRVDVAYEGRPEWLEGDYAEWVSAWNG